MSFLSGSWTDVIKHFVFVWPTLTINSLFGGFFWKKKNPCLIHLLVDWRPSACSDARTAGSAAQQNAAELRHISRNSGWLLSGEAAEDAACEPSRHNKYSESMSAAGAARRSEDLGTGECSPGVFVCPPHPRDWDQTDAAAVAPRFTPLRQETGRDAASSPNRGRLPEPGGQQAAARTGGHSTMSKETRGKGEHTDVDAARAWTEVFSRNVTVLCVCVRALKYVCDPLESLLCSHGIQHVSYWVTLQGQIKIIDWFTVDTHEVLMSWEQRQGDLIGSSH